MERLTKRNEDGSVSSAINCPDGCKYFTCSMEEGQLCYHECEADYMCKLAEYEDLEEQGLLLRLPVKEGSTVYVVDYIFNCKHRYECPCTIVKRVDTIFREKYKCEEDIRCEHEYKEYRVRNARFNHHMIDKIGETVFLTKEEAKKKLKELTK